MDDGQRIDVEIVNAIRTAKIVQLVCTMITRWSLH